MKHFFTLAITLLCTTSSWAQFSIESPDYSGDVPVDVSFTDHTVYITNELSDSLYLGWKMVENTCPEAWTYVLCDYGFCYDGLPPSGTMQAVPEGEDAFLKLSVFANGVDGSGYIRFWVYESDNQADYEVITFYFNMPVGIAESTSEDVHLWPNPSTGLVNLQLSASTDLCIRSMNGALVKQIPPLPAGNHALHLDDLPTGLYILQLRSASGTYTRTLHLSN